MTQEAQLKACPFCGDKDDYNPSVSKTHGYKYPGTGNKELVHKGWYVECDKCGGSGANTDRPDAAGKAEAIAAWNTRIESGVVAELVEVARQLRNAFDAQVQRMGDRDLSESEHLLCKVFAQARDNLDCPLAKLEAGK